LHWHRKYMEGKLSLTPLKVIQMADEECQILKHSNQWVETIDPSITAFQASLEEKIRTSQDILQNLTVHLGYDSSSHLGHPPMHYSHRDTMNRCTLDGGSFYDAPEDLQKPRYYNGHYWYFCTKCGRNGHWVCTQHNDTHKDTFPPYTDNCYYDRRDNKASDHSCRHSAASTG